MKSCAFNLGEVIGDYAGRLTSSTISVALKDLTIIPPGLLVAGETIKAYGLQNSGKIPFTYTDYKANIPYTAFEVYSRLAQGGKDLLFHTGVYSEEVLSPLLLRMSALPLELKLATQSVYVTAYTLYIDLLTHLREGCPISFTKTDIKDFIYNMDWLYNQVSCLNNVSSHIEFLDVLNLLMRSVAFCKEYDSIFNGVTQEDGYITSNRCLPGYTPPKTILTTKGGQ